MSCPTNETIERLALGFLENDGAVRGHVESCASCGRRLSELRGEHETLTRAAKAVALPNLAARRSPVRRPHAWAAAAALLVVVAAMVLFGSRKEPAPAPQIAQREQTLMGDAPATTPPPAPDQKTQLFGYRGPAKEVDELRDVTASIDLALRSGNVEAAREKLADLQRNHPGAYDTLATRLSRGGIKNRYGDGDPVGAEPKPPPPPDMTFENPGVNPTTDTTKETQSTFALDVDTASYALARQYLRDGRLPPAAAVRVEEFVNYFKYLDEAPPVGTFGIRLEVAPSPFDKTMHLLRVGIKAKELKKKERRDFVLTLIVDVSGSMSTGNRLELVKKTIAFLLDQLRPTDKIAICTFTTYARKLTDAVSAAEKEKILALVEPLTPQQSTNVGDGLKLGYEMASAAFDPKCTNRVIIFSDGVANSGDTTAESMLDAIGKDAARGIYLTAIGVGMGNYNDAILEKLANKGNGNYAYVDDLAEAKKAFGEKLIGTLDIVAIDAKLQAEFDAATVSTFRLVGYENRKLANEDFRNDKVDAGEVGPGHQVTALYEIALKPGAKGRIVTVRIRFKEPGTNEALEDQQSISAGQVLPALKDASPSYRLAAAVTQFAEVLRGSPRAKEVSLDRVHDEAKAAAVEMDKSADAMEFVELVRIAQGLKK